MARAILAEDEPLVRGEIREALHALWPDLDIIAEAGDGIEALEVVEKFRPDVVFLDINMPGIDGIEVAQRLSGRSRVVFISAFDQYAVAAFEQGAVDYVLKPLTTARMQRTVARLRERLDPRGYVHSVAEDVISALYHVTHVNPDP